MVQKHEGTKPENIWKDDRKGSGFATTWQVNTLEQKVKELEQKIKDLEYQIFEIINGFDV